MRSREESGSSRPPPRERSGAASARTAVAIATISLSLFAVWPTGAAEWGLAELMDALARRGAERALFVEKKYIAILDKPVESSGELRYTRPDRLEKRTLKPKPESMVLEGDRLAIERGTFKQTVRLADYPAIAALVDSIRGALGGDRRMLERVYRLEVHGTPERWTLVMLPSDQGLAAMVSRVDIGGIRDRVRSIDILQADGDRSVMTIEPIVLAPGAGTLDKARNQ